MQRNKNTENNKKSKHENAVRNYSSTTRQLIDMLSSDAVLKKALTESIAKAKELNPDRDTNPAQSLDEFIDFVEWSSTTLPRFILKLPTGRSLYDHMDQGVDYLYFLIDQPLDMFADKGWYFNSVQYYEPFASWVKEYCRKWGSFLSTPESWKPEYSADFYADSEFGVPEGWYEDRSNWITYNDFFSRRLKDPSQRPIAGPQDNSLVVSPVDGWPQGVWPIDDEGYIVQRPGVLLKSKYFNSIPDLIGPDSKWSGCFAGGTLTHVFLDVNDYHRYHFPLSGKILEMRKIDGVDAGGGVYHWSPSLKRYYLESRNPGWETIETRACVILDTEEYGLVAMLPIGMSQICSVNFADGLKVGDHVVKGQELGYFLFGGSDFVIIFQKGVSFKCTAPLQSSALAHEQPSADPNSDASSAYAHILMGQPYGRLSRA